MLGVHPPSSLRSVRVLTRCPCSPIRPRSACACCAVGLAPRQSSGPGGASSTPRAWAAGRRRPSLPSSSRGAGEGLRKPPRARELSPATPDRGRPADRLGTAPLRSLRQAHLAPRKPVLPTASSVPPLLVRSIPRVRERLTMGHHHEGTADPSIAGVVTAIGGAFRRRRRARSGPLPRPALFPLTERRCGTEPGLRRRGPRLPHLPWPTGAAAARAVRMKRGNSS